ncbi:MAG: DUF2950 family protein, partial [Planctomycetota bacterium]|nr:DUF2950 family protein [Planctomycetota bacterium]
MNLPQPAPPVAPAPIASAPARWQYGLADLLFASVLVALGLLIAAPLNVIWLGERERSFEAVLAVHAALTAAACALALARAQRQREPGRDLRLFMLLYAAGAWLLYAVWTRTPDGCVPVLGAFSLPLGLLAWVRIQAKRCEGLRCEACAAAWLFILWGPALTAIFTGTLDDRGCFANESAGIAACKSYAEAQDIYRRTDWDGNGVLEYAQTFSGRWSLYERNAGAGDLTLVDQAFARADLATGAAVPRAGYVFKILKAQGPDAPG